jgi:hypothetical protein
MKSFECRYAMYYNHKGVKSSIYGKNIIDALKNSNPNGIVVTVRDEDGTEYIVKEHDKTDSNGYFNQYWVNKETGEVLYDTNTPENIIKPESDPEYKPFDNVVILDTDDELTTIRKGRVIYGDDSIKNAPLIIESNSVENGVKVVIDGVEYFANLCWIRKSRKRTVTLNITSYRGISSDAIHYYGKLEFDGIDAEFKKDDGIWNTFPSDEFPICWQDWKIEVLREINEEDKTTYKTRFEGYRIGEPTNRFNTREDVVNKAKQLFYKRFRGDWEFQVK